MCWETFQEHLTFMCRLSHHCTATLTLLSTDPRPVHEYWIAPAMEQNMYDYIIWSHGLSIKVSVWNYFWKKYSRAYKQYFKHFRGHKTYFIMFYTAYIIAWIDIKIYKVDRSHKGASRECDKIEKKSTNERKLSKSVTLNLNQCCKCGPSYTKKQQTQAVRHADKLMDG